MGTTLDNGIYLPDEGERNCYEGLAGNWVALDNHLGSTNIHVTINDKQAWDGHVADTTIHVTSADKQAWNSKADNSALTAHTGDTTIHVTAEDKNKWDAVTSKANDSDVVHKSGNETISGTKTITDTNLVFKSTSAEYGVSAGDSSVIFRDKNNLQIFKIYSRVFYAGVDNNLVNFYLTQKVDNTYYTSNGIQLVANTGNKNAILRPILANNNADGLSVSLGDSNRRWSDVQTYKVNALEPSSLSLPSGNVSDTIDISSYITDLSGGINEYTASVNGWITITCLGCTGIRFSITNFWANGSYRGNPSQISCMIPICKSQKVGIYIYGSSPTVQTARFIPCQGNI